MIKTKSYINSSSTELDFIFSSDFESIREYWKDLGIRDVLASDKYLSFIKGKISDGIEVFYAVVKQGEIPVGGLIFQLKKITLSESIRDDGANFLISSFKKVSKFILEKTMDIYTLTCGNLYVTGEYSFNCNRDIEQERKLELMKKTSELLASALEKERRINVGLYLYKDFYIQDNQNILQAAEFSVQPNMVMDIVWPDKESYLKDFKSKYRVRYRKSKKCISSLTRKELDEELLESYQNDIYRLYRSVSDNAGFNLFILSKDYFYQLKKSLTEDCRVYGYFDSENKLVAFYSLILNNAELEAHFLGYEKELNSKHQLYQNMLFDIVEEAISNSNKRINFSRTALEIKSTVGAYPREMYLYLKHKNSFLNKLLPHLVKYFMPKYEFVPRSPFKQN